MSMSSRFSRARKVWAAEAMEEKDVRSRGRWTISHAEGMDARMDFIAAVALEGVRAAR